MKKRRLSTILLFAIAIFFFCDFKAYAEPISEEKLFSNLNEAERSFEDFSCKFVTITGESGTMSKFSTMLGKSTGQSLPNEQEMFVWVKKPYLMKTKASYADMIVKKEGEDFYAYYWYPKMNTLDKAKMPRNSWPAYPSPESELVMLKRHVEKASAYNIEKNDTGYVLTVNSSDSNRKDVYYIDDANWMIYKHLLYENDKLSMTYEWRDIQLNTGLSDDFFEFQVPEDAKRTTRDLSKSKQR